MLDMLRDLVAHKGHANDLLLSAIHQHEGAVADPEITELLHHILIANRFWLLAVMELPFVLQDESRRSSSFDDLVQRYRNIHDQESAWLATATDTDLARELRDPLIPGGRCSVSQALMQVCLHSHGHRAQCAKMLRRHGGTPPATEFVVWLAARTETHERP